jgi:hypothetical protein
LKTSVFGKTLTLITKAPDRPHEVVAAAAELVVVDVGVTGTEIEVMDDGGGRVAGGELAMLDTPGCVLAAEGVFGRPGTGVSNGSGQCLVHRTVPTRRTGGHEQTWNEMS